MNKTQILQKLLSTGVFAVIRIDDPNIQLENFDLFDIQKRIKFSNKAKESAVVRK